MANLKAKHAKIEFADQKDGFSAWFPSSIINDEQPAKITRKRSFTITELPTFSNGTGWHFSIELPLIRLIWRCFRGGVSH